MRQWCMQETLKPETPAEVTQEGRLFEVAGQAVRANQKPRKPRRTPPKRKKK